MEKKNKQVFIVIGIIILLLVFLNFQKEEFTSMNIHYYQKGVEIFPETSFFSLVTPPGGSFDQISFDVIVQNSGETIINGISIMDASPTPFLNALPTNSFDLNSGETNMWISNLIDTEQFEAISPVNFWVKVSGIDGLSEELIYAEAYSGDINFESELPSLVVTNSISLGGNQEYSSVIVYEGGIINVDSSGWLNIIATNEIIILGTINSFNVGSGVGNGGNGGTTMWYSGQWIELAGGGGGAGHGSKGSGGGSYQTGAGGGGGAMYGSESDFSVNSGSKGGRGGGSRGGSGGVGSGWLQLTGKNINISGNLNFAGSNGGSGSSFSGITGGGGGGGSAGTILINGENVNLDNANINLQGGGGGGGAINAGNGGGGAGGRLKVFYENSFTNLGTIINLGGSGTSYLQEI